MGKLDEKIAVYKGALEKAGVSVNDDLLMKVTRGCGPSIYNVDAECVASSDPKEMDTVKSSFLMKKMGQTDSDACDAAIKKVIDTIGSSNPKKYRPVVYYMLVKELGLESKY